MMEKKLLTQEEQAIDWLKNEIKKDQIELTKEKERMIQSIKTMKIDEIIKPKEKLTLWKRIRKVMMGY
jgi:hypothetical protein